MIIIERIHNLQTGETVDIEREETAEEKKFREKAEADLVLSQTEAEAKAAERQAILDRLGLTADEAKLLLG
jgi:hypothetical protein